MGNHIPNPDTYRPLLGKVANLVLFKLVDKKNSESLAPLGVNEYLRKMIDHWYEQEFKTPSGIETKPYYEGLEIVQSA